MEEKIPTMEDYNNINDYFSAVEDYVNNNSENSYDKCVDEIMAIGDKLKLLQSEKSLDCEGCVYNRFGCDSLGYAVDCTLMEYACIRSVALQDHYTKNKELLK